MTDRRAQRLLVAGLAVVLGACSAGAPRGEPPDAALEGWHYQLVGTPPDDLAVAFAVLDPDEVPTDVVAAQSATGTTTICYVSAGTVEDWRADAAAFPREVVGAPLPDWPGERWLDTRRTEVLVPLMARRLERCRDRGFEGVELDNVDGHANDTGFPLQADDQVRYLRALAQEARDRGLQVALKNAGDLVPEVGDDMDLAIVEECLELWECGAYDPFVDADKPVLAVEYVGDPERICPRLGAHRFLGLLADRSLDGAGIRCPTPG